MVINRLFNGPKTGSNKAQNTAKKFSDFWGFLGFLMYLWGVLGVFNYSQMANESKKILGHNLPALTVNPKMKLEK